MKTTDPAVIELLLKKEQARDTKDAIEKFIFDLMLEIDVLDASTKKLPYRIFKGKLPDDAEYGDINKYSALRWGTGISPFVLQDKIRELKKKHIEPLKKLID